MNDHEAKPKAHGAESLSTAGLGRKWCYYCGKDTHNDAECNSTRPKDWKPTCQPALTLCPTCGNDFRKCVAMRPNAEVTGGPLAARPVDCRVRGEKSALAVRQEKGQK